MAVTINQINDTRIDVGDKIVRKDADNNWVCAHELTPDEHTVFQAHLRSIGEI